MSTVTSVVYYGSLWYGSISQVAIYGNRLLTNRDNEYRISIDIEDVWIKLERLSGWIQFDMLIKTRKRLVPNASNTET